MMKYNDRPSNSLDMHAAREVLRDERDRQMRILQDDDRKRGILAGNGTASSTLRLPDDLQDSQNYQSNTNNNNTNRRNGNNLQQSSSSSPPPPNPRNVIVSGASQLVGQREPSPNDVFSRADSVLCVITLVSAINPANSWTFPATSHVFNQFEQSALVPICQPPVPLHRTVIANSTHTQRTLSLLSEYVRDVMLGQTECTTCILAGPRVVHSDRSFWTTWDPTMAVDPEDQEAENLAAADAEYEPNLPTVTMGFPGELLQPVPGLVGRQWPSQQGMKKPEHLDEDDF